MRVLNESECLQVTGGAGGKAAIVYYVIKFLMDLYDRSSQGKSNDNGDDQKKKEDTWMR